LKVVSKRLQRVTQWMSIVISRVGSDVNSSQESVTGLSTCPKTLKSRSEIRVRDGSRVQDGPLFGQVLPGREAIRVVAGLLDLAHRARAEHRFLH
jgi:hypothetical protein